MKALPQRSTVYRRYYGGATKEMYACSVKDGIQKLK